ncbi:MAG: 6,7-dimethyl-8-ribityllumazine synthase [Gemmatimonadetes bacterium]|nr:MAG: 6,7-dimethyl-8-ribityllumazine synthase [Gemmatimonadota bacterium]
MLAGAGDHLPETPRLPGRRVAVVAALFNPGVVDRLLERCLEGLRSGAIDDGAIDVFRVPGAWEIPQTVARLVETERYDGVVTLGCVIRGETPHFDYVAGEAAHGLGAVARRSRIPVVFGVLTVDTPAQADERADPLRGDKGAEFARSLLHMMALYDGLEEAP